MVAALQRELRSLVEFDECSINFVDRQRRSYLAYFTTPEGVARSGEWNPLPPSLEQALARRQLELDQIQVVEELTAGPATVEGQAGQLQQVVLDLLHNSHQAMAEAGKGGRVWVRTRKQDGWVRVEVEDEGPGIPEEIRVRIFDPFFTTREVGRGTGLGLSVCHTIAQEHGGRLWAEPRAGGACLVLELPATTETREASPSAIGAVTN